MKRFEGCWRAARLALLSLACALPAFGQRRVLPAPGPGTAGMVTLPYRVGGTDPAGNQWMIYNGGWIRQQGNMPVFGEVAVLTVNGANPMMNANQAKLEGDGQVLLENMNLGTAMVTRRVAYDKELECIRVLDVLKNTTNQQQTYQVNIRSSVNYGIQAATLVPDPKKQGQHQASIVQDSQGRVAAEVFAGRGSKVAPNILAQPNGNNQVQATLSVVVPAGKEAAILHLHTVLLSADAGQKFVAGIKESKLLASIPPPLRKLVVNFAGGQNFIGDAEVLRGDVFDVVELRGGDQFRGTLKEPSYKLDTFYGSVELPADRVVGMMNVGQFRPRQLLVTSDGEIFGGKLEKEQVKLELSNAQVIQVPVSQISRLGYRRRAGEPEEWTFEKPMVVLRSGDRMRVEMPSAPVEVLTRYGLLKVPAEQIAAVVFQPEESGVHEVQLVDGSKFAGLVTAGQMELKLSGGGQVIKLPVSEMARLQLAKKSEGADDAAPDATLAMGNNDRLVGVLQGQLKLDTAFDAISLNAGEVRRMTRAAESPLDVQVQLWDDSKVSGQLEQAELECRLNSGLVLKVPVSLVSEYNQPSPQASGAMGERIKAVVADLSAEDWRARDRAEQQLVSMGPVVVSVLKEMRPKQPPEAQQRIDSVLKQLEKGGEKLKAATPVPAGAAGAVIRD